MELETRKLKLKIHFKVPAWPLSAQECAGSGFNPGAGVSVATIVAVPSTGTLDGAESRSEKPLVIDITAEICFEGSATLCAVMSRSQAR